MPFLFWQFGATYEPSTEDAGLYLHPSERALVLCVDENSLIQRPNRTQPGTADVAWTALPRDP